MTAPSIPDLLAEIRAGGPAADEAAVTLGLLIERAARGPQNDDGDISEALPPALADRLLTPDEHRTAVDGLIAYVDESEQPLPLAVWALAKTDDRRVVPALLGLLARTVDGPEHEHLAYQALTGAIPFDGPEVRRAVRDAAERGHGRVGEGARRYLEINPD